MLVNEVKTITVAAEKVTPIPGINKAVVCAALTNAGVIYIGDETAQDFPLEIGNALDLPGEVVMEMYVRGTAGDKLVILGFG